MKVSFKARHGRHKSSPEPHKTRRKKIPAENDRIARRRRRAILTRLRVADLEDESDQA